MKQLFFIFFIFFLLGSASGESNSFSGVWETNWGLVEIFQDGHKATGTYGGDSPGKFIGTVNGNRLDFEWMGDDNESGLGYFILSEDGQSISGEWGYDSSNKDGGEWSGKKRKG